MPDETQATVGQWANETFPGADPESPRRGIRLLEETLELCLAMGAAPAQISRAVSDTLAKLLSGKPKSYYEGVRDPVPLIACELADCQIVLYTIAAMLQVEMQGYVNSKMAINRGRKWKANGDGTGYHIKDK